MARPRVATVLQATYNPVATCTVEGCSWKHPSSRETRDLAKRHTLNTGHETNVLVESIAVYRREGGDS